MPDAYEYRNASTPDERRRLEADGWTATDEVTRYTTIPVTRHYTRVYETVYWKMRRPKALVGAKP